MPKVLAPFQDCWENNDSTGWEKELKPNHLLVKKVYKGENGNFHRQTYYEYHADSQAEQEERERKQRIKDAERVREECKQVAEEAKKQAEEIRKNTERIKKECEKETKKWKEEHKNEWRTCQKCGKNFCLGKEGSIKKTWSNWSREKKDSPPTKIEYFCGNCTER